MSSRLFSRDHNTYHRRFRDTWLQREKEATRPFTFQAKAAEMAKNQYKSELLIRSHPRGRGFESHQVHHKIHRNSDRITVDLSVASFRRACGSRRIHGAEMEIAATGFMVPLPAARQVSQDTPSPVSQTAGGGAS